MAERITVSRLNDYMRRVIQQLPSLRELEIVGELSGVRLYGGTYYFTLKDSKAMVRCVMYADQARRLNFEPKDGQSVIVQAYGSFYPQRGDFQLQVRSLALEGLGALYQAYLDLKDKLEKEGLFAPERKKELPVLPKRIGVVTSAEGAVIRDIIHVLRRRNPHFELVLAPARVQGEKAAVSLIRSLRLLDQEAACDVIIIGRGGGSLEDLWPFNDEALAREIAACQTPVVSAVGHETDFSICDWVADRRAPTPSAAAEIVMPVYAELVERLDQQVSILKHALARQLEHQKRYLKQLVERPALRDPLGWVKIQQERLEQLLKYSVLREPERIYGPVQQRLDMAQQALFQPVQQRFQRDTRVLERLAAQLDALSPLRVLGRGYQMSYAQDGHVISSVQQLETGQQIRLHFVDGTAEVEVLETTASIQEEKK